MQQVSPGDAQIQGALTHVDRDVTRTQIEELDAIVLVSQGEVFAIGALPIAGFPQQLSRRVRQGALVGQGYAQQVRVCALIRVGD